MQILIIEDEQRASNQLQRLLQQSDYNFQVLEVIDSVEDAVLWFRGNPMPDLVFMDIQLADGLSFEIFQKLEVTAPIIFTTAFDQYAIQAFKVNSVDYLLKPIQEGDLNAALQKFKKSSQSRELIFHFKFDVLSVVFVCFCFLFVVCVCGPCVCVIYLCVWHFFGVCMCVAFFLVCVEPPRPLLSPP